MGKNVKIELTISEESLTKIIHESTNISIDRVESLIMDEILANLSDKDATLIESGVKPEGEWARGVWWAINKMRAALSTLKKEEGKQ